MARRMSDKWKKEKKKGKDCFLNVHYYPAT